MLFSLPKFKHFLLFILAIFVFNLSFPFSQFPRFLAIAQEGGVDTDETLGTNPKSREPTITAIVPDLAPPAVPILIDPENNEVLTDNTPTFVWHSTSGDLSLDSFDLYLDGEILYEDIPTYSVDTNLYTLIYDEDSDYYSLTPKATLADGTYTWKIIAKDTNNNQSSSVTWSFTIDTTSPFLIITAIGSTSTSISSQDLETIPDLAVQIQETNPLLVGTGEANAAVELIIEYEDGRPTTYHNFVIQADGTWQLQLSNLPKDIIIYLNFIITDQVGNIAFLSNVPITISSGSIAIPTQPVEPFEPTLPSPIPTAPIFPSPLEPINLPFPIEILTGGFLEVIGPVTEKILLDNMIVLILILTMLLLRLLILIWPLISTISLSVLMNAVGTLFFLPFSKKIKRGLVFDNQTGLAVPYAPVYFYYHDQFKSKQTDTIFTDKYGLIYHLPSEGVYSLTIEQPACLYPTAYQRPEGMDPLDLYKGEQLLFEARSFPSIFYTRQPL